MNAMVLQKAGQPLVYSQVPVPKPASGEVLIRVTACGVCRTDLHIVDGELRAAKFPLIPGHEVMGQVVALGPGVTNLRTGTIVGVPWLGYTCGTCIFCRQGKENLCNEARFTGYTLDGGYAEFMVADARFCLRPGVAFRGASAAPLLCAGLIGFRAYRMVNPAAVNIGLYGFGAAAHILTQVARMDDKKIFAFTREGDSAGQAFARQMGACWAGESGSAPPEKLDAAIIFAPVGDLVVEALRHTAKAGQVICGGIHMSDIPSFSYDLLWEEHQIRSVANLTRKDGADFFKALKTHPVSTEVQYFSLTEANTALALLRQGKLRGAGVLLPLVADH